MIDKLPRIDKILEYDVTHLDTFQEDDSAAQTAILFDHEMNVMLFKIQKGPIQEAGPNGCSIECLIEGARILLSKGEASESNKLAMLQLTSAIQTIKTGKGLQ